MQYSLTRLEHGLVGGEDYGEIRFPPVISMERLNLARQYSHPSLLARPHPSSPPGFQFENISVLMNHDGKGLLKEPCSSQERFLCDRASTVAFGNSDSQLGDLIPISGFIKHII